MKNQRTHQRMTVAENRRTADNGEVVRLSDRVLRLENTMETILPYLATKADLADTEGRLNEKINGVHRELNGKIENVRTEVEKVRTEVEKVRTEVKSSANTQIKWTLVMVASLFVGLAGVLYTIVSFGQSGMNATLQQMDRRFVQMENRFEQIDKRFEQMDKRFDRIEQALFVVRPEIAKAISEQSENKN